MIIAFWAKWPQPRLAEVKEELHAKFERDQTGIC